MKNTKKSFLSRVFREQNGQIIPWMALLSTVIIGVAGLSIDLGVRMYAIARCRPRRMLRRWQVHTR